MPIILGLEEKQQAVKEIGNAIKDFAAIEEFMSSENPSGNYTIIKVDANGKKVRIDIHCESTDDINLLVDSHKDQLKKRILFLAEKHQIGLDEEEKKILNIE